MRDWKWKTLSHIDWKNEAPREYVRRTIFRTKVEQMYKIGHLAETFSDRAEWSQPGAFRHEKRGYWEHLYIGGPDGVSHLVCNVIDDESNTQAASFGYIPDTGRRANTIEQRIFKELNGVTERDAFGYSEPALNKCVPKQLYYINRRWLNKKITCAGKADYSSHYPANICGPLPNWGKYIRIQGTVKPTPEYPFVFYTRSGHLAEYKRFDTHDWRDEELSGELFGIHYSKVPPEEDISIVCPAAKYTLDSTIEFLYNKKLAGEIIDGLPAKTILNSSIGYKHLKSAHNSRNRLYHLAAVCIARANQMMIDLFNENRHNVLQIVVDGIIYMGSHAIGEPHRHMGTLHQEITDHSFIMRGINQYMFIDRKTGSCSCYAHSGCDCNIRTDRLEDIREWQRSVNE